MILLLVEVFEDQFQQEPRACLPVQDFLEVYVGFEVTMVVDSLRSLTTMFTLATTAACSSSWTFRRLGWMRQRKMFIKYMRGMVGQ